MAHRTGQNRFQFGLFATPLDEMIARDNMVRVIDAFVDSQSHFFQYFSTEILHEAPGPEFEPGKFRGCVARLGGSGAGARCMIVS